MWIHSYRPLGDHCERKQIRRCPRRPSRPDCPQGRRRARPAPAPRGSQGGPFGTQHGPGCRLCPRAQQLIAPPRGSLSAVGGIDKPSRGLAALQRACGVWDPLVQAGCRVPAPRSRSRGPRGGSAACGGPAVCVCVCVCAIAPRNPVVGGRASCCLAGATPHWPRMVTAFTPDANYCSERPQVPNRLVRVRIGSHCPSLADFISLLSAVLHMQPDQIDYYSTHSLEQCKRTDRRHVEAEASGVAALHEHTQASTPVPALSPAQQRALEARLQQPKL